MVVVFAFGHRIEWNIPNTLVLSNFNHFNLPSPVPVQYVLHVYSLHLLNIAWFNILPWFVSHTIFTCLLTALQIVFFGTIMFLIGRVIPVIAWSQVFAICYGIGHWEWILWISFISGNVNHLNFPWPIIRQVWLFKPIERITQIGFLYCNFNHRNFLSLTSFGTIWFICVLSIC